MIKTVYNAQDVYLLDVAPDWSAPFGLEASVIMVPGTGLSNREGRRPYSLSLRLRSTFSLTADGTDANRIVGALRDLTTEPVLVPLWPAAVRWADRATRPIGGGLNLVFKEDFSQYAIYEGVEPGWPAADDLLTPLMWGRLDNRGMDFITGERFQMQVDHIEASPASYAVLPAAVVFTAGPSPSGAYGTAPRLFPYEINFDGPQRQEFTVAILREELGFTRQPAETFYPQGMAREQSSGHFLTTLTEAAGMLEFFRQHSGGKAFWVSDFVSSTLLTANVAAVDTVLQVSDTKAIKAGDWLAFLPPTGVVCRRVQSIGANTVTLTAAAGSAMPATETQAAHLMLVKLAAPKIALQWHSGDYAEARLPVRELTEEYTPAADETLGTTIGLLPTRCYLYEFARVLDGATFTDRYTPFENDLTYGGHTYASVKMQHGEIVQGLFLDKDEVEAKTDIFTGLAMIALAKGQMEAPLLLTIIEADVNAGAAVNASVIFSGEVSRASVRGSRLMGRGLSAGTMFDRQVPRVLFQTGCNNSLYDAGCTQSKADWKFSAKMQNVGTPGYPFDFILNTLAGVGAKAIAALAVPAVFTNWFAGGWIEFGTGLNWNRRAILASSAVVAGVVTVTLDRDPTPFPAVNDNVALFPGCDGRMQTCKAYDAANNPDGKFNNYLNFLGHPFMPIANPSVLNYAKAAGGGKK